MRGLIRGVSCSRAGEASPLHCIRREPGIDDGAQARGDCITVVPLREHALYIVTVRPVATQCSPRSEG